MQESKKEHWEKVYETKSPQEVSWTQEIPQTSLDLINKYAPNKHAKIIDVGGGDSKLVDFLMEQGYTDLTVLDISAKALERAKLRLGDKAKHVKWIVADVTEFGPTETYDIWHDRAVFHFLTEDWQKEKYKELVSKYVAGHLILATFSDEGPKKCSGLEICQYNASSLEFQFSKVFTIEEFFYQDHNSPFNTLQNFIFTSFKRKLIH